MLKEAMKYQDLDQIRSIMMLKMIIGCILSQVFTKQHRKKNNSWKKYSKKL
jgi:hypothetical protein